MPNRRELVQSGAVLATIASVAPPGLARAQTRNVLPIYKVVFDRRFAEARMFAAEAKLLGAKTQGIHGDVNDLWSGDLYHQWRTAPAAIAGMTTYAALFSLETMAQDAGLRTVYRVHHRVSADGSVTHDAFGPENMADADLVGAGGDWSRKMAGIVTRWPANHEGASTIASADMRTLPRKTLVSWIIAPRKA